MSSLSGCFSHPGERIPPRIVAKFKESLQQGVSVFPFSEIITFEWDKFCKVTPYLPIPEELSDELDAVSISEFEDKPLDELGVAFWAFFDKEKNLVKLYNIDYGKDFYPGKRLRSPEACLQNIHPMVHLSMGSPSGKANILVTIVNGKGESR